jgi:hypothetical protein
VSTTKLPGFTAEVALPPTSTPYYTASAPDVHARGVTAAQSSVMPRRGDLMFLDRSIRGHTGGAIPLSVHECLGLGGKVELHQWCNTGLKCTTEGGRHAMCIDEGILSP